MGSEINHRANLSSLGSQKPLSRAPINKISEPSEDALQTASLPIQVSKAIVVKVALNAAVLESVTHVILEYGRGYSTHRQTVGSVHEACEGPRAPRQSTINTISYSYSCAIAVN